MTLKNRCKYNTKLTDGFLSIYLGISYSHNYLKDFHRFYQGSIPFYYCDIYKATE